ncbi:hypothetical protein DNTS_017918 [Danionella cerebrum]|uniref:Tetraspanin n=1 Tax=Danionella cerebrum TaxID=2873325 RepID=A0A553MSB6_9TELE|nr:hypothetical protein DNTS_017918 [Danionella translucida]
MCGHSKCVGTLGACVDTRNTCGHPEHVRTLRACADTQSMCGHSEHVRTLRACADTRSMCERFIVFRYFNCSAPGVQACSVPPSCCIDPLENGTVWNSQCGVGALQLDEFSAQSVIFLGGCLGSIARWVERNGGVIITVVLIVLGVQILTLFITARLLQSIRRNRARHDVYLQSLR